MVFGKQSLQGNESNRRYADGVRVENTPRIHDIGYSRRDSKFMTELQCEPEQMKGRDRLHVNVQRHCMVRTRKHRKMCL